jgi:glycosyltransferase involved in cell wall biosynthesis
VVGTSEVGAIESVDRSVAAAVPAGDPAAMAAAITEMLRSEAADPAAASAMARSEAERLFAPAVVCEQISAALLALTARESGRAPAPVS